VTGGLTVEHFEGNEGVARRVAGQFAAAEAAVEDLLGAPLPERLRAVVAPTEGEFARRYGQLTGGRAPPEYVLAVAFPDLDVVIIRQTRLAEGTGAGLTATLRHELAHLALGRVEARRGGRLPRWLNEGLAEWASGRRLSPEERSAVQGWARFGQLTPLDDLTRRFPDHGPSNSRAYTQSLAFVAWLDDRTGGDGVRRLVADLAAGRPTRRALEDVAGLPLSEAELEWQADLIEDHSIVESLFFSLNVWGVMALVAVLAAVRHFWRNRRLKREMAEAEAREDAARRPPAGDVIPFPGPPTDPPDEDDDPPLA